MSADPPFIVHRDDVEEKEGRYPPPFEAEVVGRGRDLGRAAGSQSLGAWLDRLPPGQRSSFPHAHLAEEELVYVLQGHPVLRWIPGDQPPRETRLRPGSFVAFPAGTGIAHAFTNPTSEDVLLFVVGERRGGDRVAYPESPQLEDWRLQRRPHGVWTDRLAPTGEARPPATRIETRRLVLRPWEPSDVPALCALLEDNQDHLLPWMSWAQALKSYDEQLSWVLTQRGRFDRSEDYTLGVFLPDGTPIGSTGLHSRLRPAGLEIGYWIDRDHQGQGYVTEWCAALCRVASEVLNTPLVEIHHAPGNLRSAAVPQRLGFLQEATLVARDKVIWSWTPELPSELIQAAEVRVLDALGRRLL